MDHTFTPVIMGLLEDEFGEAAADVFRASPLLQYLNIKTKAASRGSKARSSFANHYAVYVLVEDYVKKGFHRSGGYDKYEGARFSHLFRRQRELPFGGKLQNHALNHRMNEEFRKYFRTCEYIPILRNAETNRYWFNENLLRVTVGGKIYSLAAAVLKIIDAYVAARRDAFEAFISTCEEIQKPKKDDPAEIRDFVSGLLRPTADARVFEISSFAILKVYYASQSVYWGWTLDEIDQEFLMLYKTGRCNANDGGIDFVMRPLGRFFQVTETTDVRKYFLDIDKVQRYPITFVVKSDEPTDELLSKIRDQAQRVYGVEKIVERYMECVEEVINIPILLERFSEVADDGRAGAVVHEILLQSRVEFNYERADEDT